MSTRISPRFFANKFSRALLPGLGLAVFSGILLGLASFASADSFDAAAKGATRLKDEGAISALFWSQDVNCAKAKGDFRKRQCRGVRDARRAKIAKQTFLVDVAGPAIDIVLKPETMSAQLTLRACVACTDKGYVVVGKGVHKVKAGSVLATGLATETKVFNKESLLKYWHKHIGGRYRAQFLVKIAAPTERFKIGDREGYKVNVVGYRLYDPCKGNVIVAKPSSNKGPVRAGACEVAPAPTESVAKTPKNVRPDRLTTGQIKEAMKPVKKLAKKCHEAYGIEGKAIFKMIIAADGKLTKAAQSGDFAGTPTGICLDKAMKIAVFPKSKKKATPITYPLVLR